MKLSLVIVMLGCAVTAHGKTAEQCVTGKNCVSTKGCRCASTNSPIAKKDTPQFVILTFDDALTDYIYTNYYEKILFGRRNPDGNNITATFYVPHEYSDYERANQLYNKGFEIATHSISKNVLNSYWQEASVETLTEEFGGQRQIISNFANIPAKEVLAARTPNLELAGNRTFQAYSQSGIVLDSSWPALSSTPLFPYTLDYLSTQNCLIGVCPNESFPGKWIIPIINLVGKDGKQCNALWACGIEGSSDDIYAWLSKQFENHYGENRAPLTLLVNSAWFQLVDTALDGLTKFLDALAETPDVFLVSHSEIVEWMKNPVPVSRYKTAVLNRDAKCAPITCNLEKGSETRYMRSCVPCPRVYPWIGNPYGESENYFM